MSADKNNSNKPDGAKPAADTGNASNPSPQNNDMVPAGNNQLLDEKAEKYLREAGNIEDMPDPQEQQEADETIQQEKKSR